MSESAKQTEKCRDEKGRWLPGAPQQGPGRPKGVKHHLSKSFLHDVAISWQAEGGDVLARVAKDDPGTYLRVVASLVPKELITRLEVGDSSQGVIINLLGVQHPLIEKDITPALDNKSDE